MTPFIMPQQVKAVDSGDIIGFGNRGGGVIRVTSLYRDGFDGEFDKDIVIGDFLLEDLAKAIILMQTPRTDAIPAQPQASRPGRRKPRWFRRRSA